MKKKKLKATKQHLVIEQKNWEEFQLKRAIFSKALSMMLEHAIDQTPDLDLEKTVKRFTAYVKDANRKLKSLRKKK